MGKNYISNLNDMWDSPVNEGGLDVYNGTANLDFRLLFGLVRRRIKS